MAKKIRALRLQKIFSKKDMTPLFTNPEKRCLFSGRLTASSNPVRWASSVTGDPVRCCPGLQFPGESSCGDRNLARDGLCRLGQDQTQHPVLVFGFNPALIDHFGKRELPVIASDLKFDEHV